MQLNVQMDGKELYAEYGESQLMLKATRNLLHRCVAVMTPDQLAMAGINMAPEAAAAATPAAAPNGHAIAPAAPGIVAAPVLPGKRG